ncbi:alpha/beta fold hydrolase [Streptomyces sp. NBC_01235]|uniref:alpha/beta fold hydrolase n=1 Tax=Streptomyces sp. NBC_01235 TaxID=2903788 RepID=UPI002E0F5286
MFRHQLSGLSPSRRVVILDPRGHGLSGKPHHGYRIARLARDVVELVDQLHLDRFDAGPAYGRLGVVELHGPVRHRPDPTVRRRRPARGRCGRSLDDGRGATGLRRHLRRGGTHGTRCGARRPGR